MARIRTVKPTLWQDEAVAEVSLEARLTFIGLITQADDYGRQKGAARLIRSLVFPYDDFSVDEIAGWLRELSEKQLILCYSVGGKEFIELPRWERHQRVSHPTDSALPSLADADSTDAPENSGAAPKSSSGKGREGKGEGRERTSPVKTADAALSNLLADLVAGNDPNGKRPTVSAAWITEEDRMLRLDKRNPKEAQRLIEWTLRDTFWRKNVRSMPTFREKYGQLYLAAVEASEKSKPKGSPGMQQAHRFAEKAREAEAAEAAA